MSDIEGTTRDTIEETFTIDGLTYRFIDTAGIRETSETIEKIGIERTFKKISEADIVIGMIDGTKTANEIEMAAKTITEHVNPLTQKLLLVINKRDLMDADTICDRPNPTAFTLISAKNADDVEALKRIIRSNTDAPQLDGNTTLVSNIRHFEALTHAKESLEQVKNGLENKLSADLLAEDLRQALYHIGSITG